MAPGWTVATVCGHGERRCPERLEDGDCRDSLIEDSQFVYELNFTDSDPGDSISWQIISQPEAWEPLSSMRTLHRSLIIHKQTFTDQILSKYPFPTPSVLPIPWSSTLPFLRSMIPRSFQEGRDSLSFRFRKTLLIYDLNGSDPDLSDLLTWEVLVTPSNGSLSVDPSTGILLYQPNQDYNGSDQFSIGLNDGVEQVAVQFQIQVTGVNDPPLRFLFVRFEFLGKFTGRHPCRHPYRL